MKRRPTPQQKRERREILKEACFAFIPLVLFMWLTFPDGELKKAHDGPHAERMHEFNHERNDKIALRFEIRQVENELADNTRRMMIMEYNHHGGREYRNFIAKNDSLIQLRDSLKLIVNSQCDRRPEVLQDCDEDSR